MTVELKSISDTDLDAYFDLLNDESLATNVGSVPHPITKEWAKERLQGRKTEECAGTNLARGLYENGVLVGEVGYFDRGQGLQIGYSIHRDHRGRGLATKAVKLIVQNARDHRRTGPVGADYFLDNPASGRVLEKAGFVAVGEGTSTSSARSGHIPACVMELRGDVALSAVRPSDYEALFDHQDDLEAQAMAGGGKVFDSEPAYREHLKKVATNGSLFRTVLLEGHVAGYIASFERFGKREISYWIGRDYWGKGIASKAVALWLRQMPRPGDGLFARVAKDHPASARVLTKNGFTAFADDRYFSDIRNKNIEETIYKYTG